MFGVDSSELFILAVLALVFIGPKELPATMRTVGRLIGRGRAHARHFTAGIENIMREAELEEMEKRWREENERIMREFPVDPLALHPTPLDHSTPVMTSLPPPVEPMAPAEEPRLPLGEPDHSGRPLP
jgi:sec-independent protein translocase protein TatB